MYKFKLIPFENDTLTHPRSTKLDGDQPLGGMGRAASCRVGDGLCSVETGGGATLRLRLRSRLTIKMVCVGRCERGGKLVLYCAVLCWACLVDRPHPLEQKSGQL